jgi:hypothetical protein
VELPLSSADAGDAVDRSVEGDDLTQAARLGLGNEVCLGEVETIDLVDLQRAEEQRGIDGVDVRHCQGRSHEFGNASGLYLVEGLEHLDAFGEDEIGE